MPLEEYLRKRDFAKTPEPAPAASPGGSAGSRNGRYVVQRHRASRLHYDFRLEIDGVLVSWAVPKGPTLDPGVRRMAVHVEDHPIEYFDFEGVIPAKQYGAGDVIVWDWGTWEGEAPTLDAAKAVEAGELKFRLDGEKLKGRFTIVRTSGRRRRGEDPSARAFEDDAGDQWLLIHKRDEAAVTGWDAEDHPQSVKTGRTNDDVKAARDALWNGRAPAASAEIDLAGAVEAAMPASIPPMLATLASKPFSDPDWLFEIKWDGFRVQAVVDGGKVRTWTRNLKDAATYFPRLLTSGTWIEARQAIVDGEVVALDEAGRPDFGLLQERLGDASAPDLVYQAFDLLYLDGRSLLDVPLEDRKRLLQSVLRPHPRVRFAAHVVGEGLAFYEAAGQQGLEGVVAKLRRSRYEPDRRSSAWLKIKVRPEQELVVGGWTPGQGNAKDLGAVAVGVYEGEKLRFSGKVGSGFDGRTRRLIRERLATLEVGAPPFDPAPPRDYRGRWGGELKDVTWVRPELVIRAELGGWSRDGMVRQAAFKGIDDERDPLTVTRERPVATAQAVRKAEAAEIDEAREAAEAGAAEIGGAAEPHATFHARSKPEPAAAVPEVSSPGDRPWAMAAARNSDNRPRAIAKADGRPTTAAARNSDNRPRAIGKGRDPATATPRTASDRPRAIGNPGDPPAPSTNPAPSNGLATTATREEFEALEAMGREGVWRVGGHELKLTNLDKPLFEGAPPITGDQRITGDLSITKRELIAYFTRIAPTMLPHLRDRPLNLQRFPNGAGAPGFWQKDIPATAPSWLRRWHETGVDGREDRDANDHLIADRVAALAWLGNQASFEIHAWTGRLPDPWQPTFALIDIDPGDRTTWDETLTLARLYRTALGHLGVRGYPKTTGKRGIQVWIPIVPRYSFSETSAWVERVSRAVGSIVPDLVSWEWAKGARKGRARLDYTQNAPIKTLVAPYSVRPAPGAPVSAPIAWDELDDPELRPDRWTIRTIVERVAERGDLFAAAQTDAQELPEV